jgi:hypothetical protein
MHALTSMAPLTSEERWRLDLFVQTTATADQHHEHAQSRADGREAEQPRPWPRDPTAAWTPARSGVRETHHTQGGATPPRLPRRHHAADPLTWRATFNATTCAPPPARAIGRHARTPSSTSHPWPARRDLGALQPPQATSTLDQRANHDQQREPPCLVTHARDLTEKF